MTIEIAPISISGDTIPDDETFTVTMEYSINEDCTLQLESFSDDSDVYNQDFFQFDPNMNCVKDGEVTLTGMILRSKLFPNYVESADADDPDTSSFVAIFKYESPSDQIAEVAIQAKLEWNAVTPALKVRSDETNFYACVNLESLNLPSSYFDHETSSAPIEYNPELTYWEADSSLRLTSLLSASSEESDADSEDDSTDDADDSDATEEKIDNSACLVHLTLETETRVRTLEWGSSTSSEYWLILTLKTYDADVFNFLSIEQSWSILMSRDYEDVSPDDANYFLISFSESHLGFLVGNSKEQFSLENDSLKLS